MPGGFEIISEKKISEKISIFINFSTKKKKSIQVTFLSQNIWFPVAGLTGESQQSLAFSHLLQYYSLTEKNLILHGW